MVLTQQWDYDGFYFLLFDYKYPLKLKCKPILFFVTKKIAHF